MIGFLPARALLLQFGACTMALTAFAVSPPARGRMLLWSISGADAGAAIRVAIDQGAGLVGRGPLPRSVIIAGDFSRLVGPLWAAGAILLAAPRGGCGEGQP